MPVYEDCAPKVGFIPGDDLVPKHMSLTFFQILGLRSHHALPLPPYHLTPTISSPPASKSDQETSASPANFDPLPTSQNLNNDLRAPPAAAKMSTRRAKVTVTESWAARMKTSIHQAMRTMTTKHPPPSVLEV
jgi:hypothetical protein